MGGNPTSTSPSATNLLYTGEQWDTDAQNYYNRARWYNPLNGLFNRMDPYSGNLQDPQSLHKYLYCHNNPINAIDPSGEMTLVGTLSVTTIICSMVSVFLPVLGGVISAVKAGISPWEFIGELVSKVTWQEALLAVGLGALAGGLLKQIASKVGSKIFSVIGAVLSVFALIKSIGLTINMASGNINRKDIAHYLAFTTAVIILSVVIGNMLRGPEKLPASGTPPGEPGIYEFRSESAKIYVGQSKNLFRRMNEHLRTGGLKPKDIKTLRWKPMKGSSKIDREIAEQLRIEDYGGKEFLANIINAIGKNREHLIQR